MKESVYLIIRSLLTTLRVPAAIWPNVVISVFFLFVYQAGLSSVERIDGFVGSYLGFILPVAIVSAAVGGAGVAGQSIIRDMESGYFTKLLLTRPLVWQSSGDQWSPERSFWCSRWS